MSKRTASNHPVLVIGYGEVGHAMEHLLGACHPLQFWDIRPVAGHEPVELEQAAAQAGFILYCVPVTPLGEVAERVLPYLPADSISLSVAKGLDAAGRPAPAIFSDVYAGAHDYGVLYGPMIAEEIMQGRPAFAQVGCSRPDVFAGIEALFQGSGLLLQYSDDVPGIAWSSVLKNVYAILFGAADELALGDNVRGFLAVAAIGEMAAIVQARGGDAATVIQLAGLGDLVTTATSRSSHHHELGRQLARGEYTGTPAEGVHTLAMVEQFALLDREQYPLFSLVAQIVSEQGGIEQRIRRYLQSL
jgi:glycerol-3-phosphate dehydrogenase (NAD(P)+)